MATTKHMKGWGYLPKGFEFTSCGKSVEEAKIGATPPEIKCDSCRRTHAFKEWEKKWRKRNAKNN